MSEAKPKKLTLSDDDITMARKQPAPPSLTNVGGGPGAAGKHVGTDPDSGPPGPKKPAPSDPDGH